MPKDSQPPTETICAPQRLWARSQAERDAKGRRRYQVDIASANDTTVTLAISADETLTIPFTAIGEAKLVLTDRLIAEAQNARGVRH